MMIRRLCLRRPTVAALPAVILAASMLAAGTPAPRAVLAHGGGGGHMGGMGGGHMGGMGGMGGMDVGRMGGMPGGDRYQGMLPASMARGFDLPQGRGDLEDRDLGVERSIESGRAFNDRADFNRATGLDGARPRDGGAPLDGGGRLEGPASLDGGRDFGPGHFAGAGNLSRADFQRIAGQAGVRGAAGRGAVRPYAAGTLANRGDAIRNNFYNGGWYGGRGWYAAHFNPWWPGGWWGGYGWGFGVGMLTGLAWSDLATWGGYASTPVAYNYGTNVCYDDSGVTVQGATVGTAEEYAQQAAALAAKGSASAAIPDDDQWRPLGVYALARAEEQTPSTFLSLAIDKQGLLRGTYYDAVADSTLNVAGRVDKQTQRAAWTLGDKSTPVYEAGLSNLTQRQTTVLVHRDGGKVEQMLLVRVDDKAGGKAGGEAGRPAAGAGQ